MRITLSTLPHSNNVHICKSFDELILTHQSSQSTTPPLAKPPLEAHHRGSSTCTGLVLQLYLRRAAFSTTRHSYCKTGPHKQLTSKASHKSDPATAYENHGVPVYNPLSTSTRLVAQLPVISVVTRRASPTIAGGCTGKGLAFHLQAVTLPREPHPSRSQYRAIPASHLQFIQTTYSITTHSYPSSFQLRVGNIVTINSLYELCKV